MRIAMACGLALLLGTLGCGSGDGDSSSVEISSDVMSGKIGGAPWSYVIGETNPALSDENIWADLYAESTSTACQAGPTGGKNSVILNIPRKAGDYNLSLSLNATFVIDATQDNLLVTRGRLVVGQATDTSIFAKAHLVLDADNEVNGVFVVSICP